MAGSAERAKLTGVCIILDMAGGTIHRRALEDTILMAILTGDGGVFTVKMERKFRVIYSCRFPTIGQMTCSTLCAKLTLVVIILCVTGETILRGSL